MRVSITLELNCTVQEVGRTSDTFGVIYASPILLEGMYCDAEFWSIFCENAQTVLKLLVQSHISDN